MEFPFLLDVNFWKTSQLHVGESWPVLRESCDNIFICCGALFWIALTTLIPDNLNLSFHKNDSIFSVIRIEWYFIFWTS